MDLLLKRISFNEGGEPDVEDKRVPVPQINEAEYRTRLAEINETFRIIRDRQTGRAFEMAIVNQSRLSNGAILMPSTMFSSLTHNVGNAIELAAHGAATPDIARVYIAFPGNGGSGNMSQRDRQYLARTGRFTRDGNALDSVLALVRALNESDIPIRSISANAEAGRLGLGIMAALPINTVSFVYFNGLPGISPKNYIAGMTGEDARGKWARRFEEMENEHEHRQEEMDEIYRVSDRTIEEAKAYLPNIYRSPDYLLRFTSTWMRALPNVRANTSAFSQHADLQDPQTHAVLQDAVTVLKLQQRAMITFQFGRYSPLHDIDVCMEFGQRLTAELDNTPVHGSVQLYISDGTLDFHTDYPSERWAAEKEALTAHFI